MATPVYYLDSLANATEIDASASGTTGILTTTTGTTSGYTTMPPFFNPISTYGGNYIYIKFPANSVVNLNFSFSIPATVANAAWKNIDGHYLYGADGSQYAQMISLFLGTDKSKAGGYGLIKQVYGAYSGWIMQSASAPTGDGYVHRPYIAFVNSGAYQISGTRYGVEGTNYGGYGQLYNIDTSETSATRSPLISTSSLSLQLILSGNSYSPGAIPGTFPYYADSPAGYITIVWETCIRGDSDWSQGLNRFFNMTWSYSSLWNYNPSSETQNFDATYVIQTYNGYSNTFKRNAPTLPFSQGLKSTYQIGRVQQYAYSSSK